jgi:hypothetical protein
MARGLLRSDTDMLCGGVLVSYSDTGVRKGGAHLICRAVRSLAVFILTDILMTDAGMGMSEARLLAEAIITQQLGWT